LPAAQTPWQSHSSRLPPPAATLSPVSFGCALLHATGAEGSSLEPDLLGFGQLSIASAGKGLAAAGALRWLASLRGLMTLLWGEERKVFVVCQPSRRDLV